jgi:hypothetical protein
MTEVARLAPLLSDQMYPTNSQRCEHARGARSHFRPKIRMAVFALIEAIYADSCCHLNQAGLDFMSQAITHAILDGHLTSYQEVTIDRLGHGQPGSPQ